MPEIRKRSSRWPASRWRSLQNCFLNLRKILKDVIKVCKVLLYIWRIWCEVLSGLWNLYGLTMERSRFVNAQNLLT
jgi:hypothetical protein